MATREQAMTMLLAGVDKTIDRIIREMWQPRPPALTEDRLREEIRKVVDERWLED